MPKLPLFKALGTPAFRLLLTAILVTELVTITVALLLLNRGISNEIAESAHRLSTIATTIAATGDWSGLQRVVNRDKTSTAVFKRIQKHLKLVNHRLFPHNNGGVDLVVVHKKQTLGIDGNDPRPLYDDGPATRWELMASKTGRLTVTTSPVSSDYGTYMAAYAPILYQGKVIALVEVFRETLRIDELQAIVRRTFLFAIIPAALIAMLTALVLSSRLVEPMEVLREISLPETTKPDEDERNHDRPLDRLSPKEREVAELVAKGMTNPEIAAALQISPETVKHHLKNIKVKTGMSRFDLAKSVWHAHLV